MTTTKLSLQEVKAEQANFIARVYGWMSLALTITGIVAMWVASSPGLVNTIIGNNFIFYGLVIGQLVCVVYRMRQERIS